MVGVAVLLGLALVAAGCGGGGSKSSAPEATTTVEETTPAATTEAESTEDAEEAETPDLSSFATSENCRRFAEAASELSQAFTGTGSADIEQTAEFFSEFASQAPSDIRADFEVLADAYAKIADALEGVDTSSGEVPSAEALQKLQELSTELDQAELAKAGTNITAWVQNNCS